MDPNVVPNIPLFIKTHFQKLLSCQTKTKSSHDVINKKQARVNTAVGTKTGIANTEPRGTYNMANEESMLSRMVSTPTRQRRESSTRFSSTVENQDELYSMTATPLKDTGLFTFKIQQNCNVRHLG